MPSNHLTLCRPLLLLPSIFTSIRVFSSESALCIRWPKYWSFSFSVNPSSEHPGLISFRMDWSDLLAVQGTLESLLQHHNSKASILQKHQSFHLDGKLTSKTGKLAVIFQVGKCASGFLWEVFSVGLCLLSGMKMWGEFETEELKNSLTYLTSVSAHLSVFTKLAPSGH